MDPSQRSAVSSVIWRSRGRLGAIPVRQVTEIMRPLPVEKIAGAPRFVSGISVIRGVPTPIVDVGLLLFEDAQFAPGRFVVVRIDGRRRVGLALDDVIGVRDLAHSLFSELPPLLREVEGGIARIGALDAELLVVLESTRIVPESVWVEVEGGG